MHVTLSDLLTCPRCGPEHGLILLPDETRDRRVVTGTLGCPNCRERYPIDAGVADLRPPTESAGPGGNAGSPDGEAPGPASAASAAAPASAAPEPSPRAAIRLAALMDLADATGAVLVVGPAAAHAAAIPDLVEGVEVVVAELAAPAGSGASDPVSRLRAARVLPFRTGSMRGVTLSGAAAAPLVEEAVRVLGPVGRLLLEGLGSEGRTRVEAAGLRVVAEEGGTLVAGR